MQLPEHGKLVEARRASKGPEIQQDISAPQPFERDLLPGGEFAALEGIGLEARQGCIGLVCGESGLFEQQGVVSGVDSLDSQDLSLYVHDISDPEYP